MSAQLKECIAQLKGSDVTKQQKIAGLFQKYCKTEEDFKLILSLDEKLECFCLLLSQQDPIIQKRTTATLCNISFLECGGNIISKILPTKVLDTLVTDCIEKNLLNEEFIDAITNATACLLNFCIEDQCKILLFEKDSTIASKLLDASLILTSKLPSFSPDFIVSYEEICYNCFIALSSVVSLQAVEKILNEASTLQQLLNVLQIKSNSFTKLFQSYFALLANLSSHPTILSTLLSIEPQLMKKVQIFQQQFSKEKDVQHSISLLMQQLAKRSSREIDSSYVENLLNLLEKEKDKTVLENQLPVIWNALGNASLKLDSLIPNRVLPLLLRHFYPQQQESLLCTCTGMLASVTTSSSLVNELEEQQPKFLQTICVPLLQQLDWNQTVSHKTTEKFACYLLLLCNNWTIAKPTQRKVLITKEILTLLLGIFVEKKQFQMSTTEEVAEKAAVLLLSLSMDNTFSDIMKQCRGIQKLVAFIFDSKESVVKRETSKSTLKIGQVLWNLSLDESNIPILEETGGFIALLLLLPQTQTETDVSWIKEQKTKKPKHKNQKREQQQESKPQDAETRMRDVISGDLHKNLKVEKLGSTKPIDGHEVVAEVEPKDKKSKSTDRTLAEPLSTKSTQNVDSTISSPPPQKHKPMSQIELVKEQQQEIEQRQKEMEKTTDTQQQSYTPVETIDEEKTDLIIPPPPSPPPIPSSPLVTLKKVVKEQQDQAAPTNTNSSDKHQHRTRQGTFLAQVKAGVQLKSALARVLSEKKVHLPPTAHEQVRQFLQHKFKLANPSEELDSQSEDSLDDWE